jgi:hypothetical protein
MKRPIVTILLLLLLVGCGQKEDVAHDALVETPTVNESPTDTDVVEPIEQPESYVFRVTAYCPCEVCCGEYAIGRPKDEYGNPIVFGAMGVELTDWYSVASPLPFGTQIELDGIGTVEIQDRTANWVVEEHGQYILDIYMTDHQEAWDFGVQYIRGELVE